MQKYFCCVSSHAKPQVSGRRNKGHDYPWEVYTLKELLLATNCFHDDNKLGEGGFGTVYYGRNSKGEQIAVKRLKAMTAKAEMEFAIEVEILGRVRHKNLLGLRGFYAGRDERLIVYDYMPNHSLIIHLHSHRPAAGSGPTGHVAFNWTSRMGVAVDSVEGLAYLHHQATPHIIHRDIKASNVLLDSDFKPKVADFGFAKLIPEGVSHLTTKVKGTLGYLEPEYAMWGKVSESCDVYSFGILLLEIVSARKPIEKLQGGIKRDIVQWVSPLVEKGVWDKIVDPRLGNNYDRIQARTVVMVAIRCTDSDPERRPTMKEVVEFLKSGMGERRNREMVVKKREMLEKNEDEEGLETIDDCDVPYLRMNRRSLMIR